MSTEKIILWIVTILGLTFGIIGFIQNKINKQEMNPVYSFKHGPLKVFDTNQLSPKLKLYVSDTVPVSENVYVANIVIWNKGKEEIHPKDHVMVPISFSVPDSFDILDYKIIDEIEPKVCNFRLNESDGSILLDWDFFTYGSGVEVQLFYTGSRSDILKVQGQVIDSYVELVMPRKKLNYSHYILLPIFIFGFFAWSHTCYKLIKTKPTFKEMILPVFATLVFATGIIAGFLNAFGGVKLPL